jgi:hypothetical protein
VSAQTDDQIEDDDRHCVLPNVLLMEIAVVLVLGRDFSVGQGLFCQSGIQRSFESDRLIALTYVLLLDLIAGAVVSHLPRGVRRRVGNIRPLIISL